MEERVTGDYLIKIGFTKDGENFGWAKYRKNDFELVGMPLKNGGFIIGFEYQYCSQTKYKYPLKVGELQSLYKIIKGGDINK